jgi:hypothetical protein
VALRKRISALATMLEKCIYRFGHHRMSVLEFFAKPTAMQKLRTTKNPSLCE